MRQLVVAFAVLALTATQAQAHAHLEGAVPQAGSTVSSTPAEIRLTFREGVAPGLSGVALADAAGHKVPTGTAALDGKQKAVLVVPVSGMLPPGVYTVRWHVVSDDSHKTEGSFTFTVQP